MDYLLRDSTYLSLLAVDDVIKIGGDDDDDDDDDDD